MAKRWSLEEKLALLEAFAQSGMTRVAFCKKKGLSVNTLHRWKKGLVAHAFVEVLPAKAVEPLRVQVRQGVVVEVPSGFDASELRRLVDALC